MNSRKRSNPKKIATNRMAKANANEDNDLGVSPKASPSNNELLEDANADIYNDLDVPPKGSPSNDVLLEEDYSMDVDSESDDLLIVKEILTNPKEEELKKAEEKLFLEILKVEEKKRTEEKLKVSDSVQKLLAEKDDEIAKLQKEKANLQLNICSLYKTAKSEMNQKDLLLNEANEKVDSLMYKRNLPKDYFQKQPSQTPSQKHDKTTQTKLSENRDGPVESSKHDGEINDRSNRGAVTRERNWNQTSGHYKRPRSPSGDHENPKTRTSTCLNKRQNCDSNDIQSINGSKNMESLHINQKSGSNIVQNGTSTTNDKNLGGSQSITQETTSNKPESVDKKKNCDLESGQNTACIDNSNILKPISDLDKSTSVQSENLDDIQIIQSTNKDPEPSVQELFLLMQEMISNDPDTLNDPDTINLIFDNLLPDELKQWFAVYERSQRDALIKLKQSFVNSYFQQCSANTAGSSKVPGEKLSMFQNFSFSSQKNSSCSKTDYNIDMSVLDKVSDLESEPCEATIKEKKEQVAEIVERK